MATSISPTWDTARDIVENLRKGELENAQNKAMELRRVRSHVRAVKKPGVIYVLLFYAAICSDVLGILFFFITFTGAGAIVAVVVSVCISIFFFLVSLSLGRKIKNNRVSGEAIANYALQTEQRINFYRTQVARGIKLARRTKAGRSVLRTGYGRKAVGLVAKFGKKSSPVGRAILSSLAEVVPWLQVIPWYTINIYLTWKEHSKEYSDTLSAVHEYNNISAKEPVAFSEFQEVQAEAATEELEDIAEEEYAQAA